MPNMLALELPSLVKSSAINIKNAIAIAKNIPVDKKNHRLVGINPKKNAKIGMPKKKNFMT
jgi:hypothetical protein